MKAATGRHERAGRPPVGNSRGTNSTNATKVGVKTALPSQWDKAVWDGTAVAAIIVDTISRRPEYPPIGLRGPGHETHDSPSDVAS